MSIWYQIGFNYIGQPVLDIFIHLNTITRKNYIVHDVFIVSLSRNFYYILELFQQYDVFCTLIGHHNPLSRVIKPVWSAQCCSQVGHWKCKYDGLVLFILCNRRWSGNFQILQRIKTIENKLKFLTFCLILIHCHYILWILKSTFIMKLRYTLKIK
jgi:hypothetical protein